jgi:hypothetical protein
MVVDNNPVGNLELSQAAPSTIRLAGWGLDRSLAGPAAVHVYVDGAWAGSISANTTRTDVGAIFPASGNNHGFDGTVPFTTAGTHQVCAWVVGDSLGGANYGLGCRTAVVH